MHTYTYMYIHTHRISYEHCIVLYMYVYTMCYAIDGNECTIRHIMQVLLDEQKQVCTAHPYKVHVHTTCTGTTVTLHRYNKQHLCFLCFHTKSTSCHTTCTYMYMYKDSVKLKMSLLSRDTCCYRHALTSCTCTSVSVVSVEPVVASTALNRAVS